MDGHYFDPYQRHVGGAEAYNLSRVKNTNFTWTADLRSLDAVPHRHVDVRQSSGLELRGNTYQNEDYAHYGTEARGTGIYTANSRLSEKWLCTGGVLPCPQNEIVRSEFLNLTTGIDAYANSTNRSLEAHYGSYRNNFIGIAINGLLGAELLNNDIKVPNVNKAMGISPVGSTGYTVENNTLTGMSTINIAKNIGIQVHSSGTDDNELYKNTFKDLDVGILSTGMNAQSPEFFYGLKWKCNTFNKTIQSADIFVKKGSVSMMQGSCLTGVTGPAGNKFSHNGTTIPNHYDLRVLPGFGQSINYRHHVVTGGQTAYLVPLRYTNGASVPGDPNEVLLENCSQVYWSSAACPVQSWGAPPTDPLGPGLMARGGNEASMSAFAQTAAALYAQLDAIEAQLDNGHTEELIDAVYGGADVETIASLLVQAGDMVSRRVLNALHASSDPQVRALAPQAAGAAAQTEVTANDIDDIALPSDEMESGWMSLRRVEVDLWHDIIASHQKDTVGAFAAEDILSMMNPYAPNTAQRFAALSAAEAGVGQPEWLHADNTLGTMAEYTSLPATNSEGRLPSHIDEWFIAGFFDDFTNTHALHTAYIESGDAYLPYVPVPFFSGDKGGGESKSKKPDESEGVETSFVLLPNPFDENLTIRASFDEDRQSTAIVRFYDALGREVMTEAFPAESGDHELNGRDLPDGLLLYRVEMGGETIQKGKVVKRR